MRKISVASFASGIILLAGPAAADSLFDLLPPEANPQAALAEVGVLASLSVTQFYGALLQGSLDADTDWKYGGKADLHVTLDGHRMGLWQGFYVSAVGELVYGENVNPSDPGILLPVNTAMYFPADGEFGTDLSLNFTQRFGENVSISVGKFNMIDAASDTPLVGGSGLETFQNITFAAPPSGLLPPYIFGGILTVTTKPAIFTLAIYDPRNVQNESGLDNPFSEGIAGMLNVTAPVTIAGLRGYQTVTLRGNNMDKVSLDEISDLIIPASADGVIETQDGAWYAGYAFQQYLFQREDGRGWGLFGTIGVADANPTPLDVVGTLGIAGNSPIRGREEDLFGLGYFYEGFSDTLEDELAPVVELGAEQGVEALYNIHLAPGVRLSADVQVIDPALTEDTAVFGGLRLQTIF